jgi:prepilin-type N-terminal cleavage/methylation domain-containing protein
MRNLRINSGESRLGHSNSGELGFTLVELLVASVLALILLLSTTTILFQTFEFADRQRLRPILNDQARAFFDRLGDGGRDDGNVVLLGLRDRGSFDISTDNANLREENRLRLNNTDPDPDIGYSQTGPKISSTVVNCRGTDDPVEGCGADGTTLTVNGYLARNPRLYINADIAGGASDRSPNDDERGNQNRTMETEILLIYPYDANRKRFRSDQVRESYRTTFGFYRTQ